MNNNRRRLDAGFTLIEIMVVMAIIAMLAATVGPRLYDYHERAKVQAASAQLTQLAMALDTFRLDIGRYPTPQEGLTALTTPPSGTSRWNGPYIEDDVPLDPWGNAYQYVVPGHNRRPYDIYSLGSDGAPGGDGTERDVTRWK